MQYWSPFIHHEISTVKGIKWYISNVLVRCGFIASIDEVAKCKNYVNNEAVRIYQSCYQDKKYCSFTIKDYEGHSNLNGLKGIISSYDSIRHQYNIIIKGNQGLSQPEYRWALSPGVLLTVATLVLRRGSSRCTWRCPRTSSSGARPPKSTRPTLASAPWSSKRLGECFSCACAGSQSVENLTALNGLD